MGSWYRLGLGEQKDEAAPSLVKEEALANAQVVAVACGMVLHG